jgi:ABC-2 type transport system permease protein
MGSYLDFLAPGIVVMTAVFSNGWSGMGTLNDMRAGVLDRLLVTPVTRPALVVGAVLHGAGSSLVQFVILIGLAAVLGAHFSGGVAGLVVLLVCAVLLGVGIGALSHLLALLLRREASVIAAGNFVLLPLVFLSSVFMQRNLMPGWIRTVASGNPVDWAVRAGRAAPGCGFRPARGFRGGSPRPGG